MLQQFSFYVLALNLVSKISADRAAGNYTKLRWYSVILIQWLEGKGLNNIMRRAVDYQERHHLPHNFCITALLQRIFDVDIAVIVNDNILSLMRFRLIRPVGCVLQLRQIALSHILFLKQMDLSALIRHSLPSNH